MNKIVSIFLFIYLIMSGQYEDHSKSLKLTFTGDFMAHNVNYLMEDYSLIYKGVEHILKGDDLTFSNLEFPVDPDRPQMSYPRFNLHPAYVKAAIDAGIDVFSMSNNHSYDWGKDGLLKTLVSMAELQENSENKMYYTGTKDNPDIDFEPLEIKAKTFKIGFVAVTHLMNAPFDADYVFYVNYMFEKEVNTFLDWLREKTVDYDLFIVSCHGGVEYAREPHPQKAEFYHKLLDAGVHIVYGHHPHVPQPYEIVNYNGLNRVIFYSTGNLISGQGYIIEPDMPADYWSYTGDSALYQVDIKLTDNGPDITKVEPILIGNYTTHRKDVIIFPLEDLANMELPGIWTNFYKQRLEIMNNFMIDNRIESEVNNLDNNEESVENPVITDTDEPLQIEEVSSPE